jgi:hypothetical protein
MAEIKHRNQATQNQQQEEINQQMAGVERDGVEAGAL